MTSWNEQHTLPSWYGARLVATQGTVVLPGEGHAGVI